jgi:P4 family phage/plasmid primase-like protien
MTMMNHEKTAPEEIAKYLASRKSILFFKGQFFHFTGAIWRRVSVPFIKGLYYEADPKYFTSKRATTVIETLQVLCNKEDITWNNLKDSEIAVKNGVLDVKTLELRDYMPEDYCDHNIPHNFNSGASCPVWIKCLADWFANDSVKWSALHQFFGYVVLPHAKYKKALFLYGDTDTGKSVILQVLRSLVGIDQTTTLPISKMADARQRAVLIGKRINIISELPNEAMIAEDGFKQLVSTEDPVDVDPKYKEPFQYIPRCKHIVATNCLPTVNDRTSATFNRMLIVPMDRRIDKSKQDKFLLAKLESEIEGILAWSIQGAYELMKNNGEFPFIAESEEYIAEIRHTHNAGDSFVKECLSPCGEEGFPVKDLLSAFRKHSGEDHATVTSLTRRLRAGGYTIRVWAPSYLDRPSTCLMGFKLETPSW